MLILYEFMFLIFGSMKKVLKFGGTSTGSAENMRQVAKIIRDEHATVTVLSAMSGTTDALVRLVSQARKRIPCETIANELIDKYTRCIESLLSGKKEAALVKMHSVFSEIGYLCQSFDRFSEKRIVAQGELLTTAIFTHYLEELGWNVRLLNAPDFMVLNENTSVDTILLKEKLNDEIRKEADDDTFFITQGFICTDALGDISNLGRGGSDYSAALIGAAIGAGQVQIWTDIDGMHNNDPRYVEHTYPLRRMTFDEAAELAYFGAKILHPSTIQPCKEAGVDVLLKNTMDPGAEGTLVSAREGSERKFHAVAAKEGITLIRIRSAGMLMAYGFLRKIFEIFEQYHTSIDMITTSEVAVSLTIDDSRNIGGIVAELEKLGVIEVEYDNTIVCIVGKIAHNEAGVAAEILNGFKDIPVKMISYGASSISMVLLVDTVHKIPVLSQLNSSLFKL